MISLCWWILIFGAVLALAGLMLWGISYLLLKKDHVEITPRECETSKVAVLIPARDESRVIEGLLDCLKKQTFPVQPNDIYVIVENADDPTVKICEKFGVEVFVRQKLSKRTARKGFALDEVIKDIFAKNKHYDLYFIFDADNRINESFIERMVLAYQAGYQIATSYRNATNANTNVVATSAALTFSMLNTVENRQRVKTGGNVVFSGTGCFVDGALVEKWRGWPFHSLTEDYEMSLYAILHSLKTIYFEEAEFFDEQPVTFRQSFTQRVRWIKGYFMARKVYIPKLRKCHNLQNEGSVKREIIGMWPFILLAAGLIICVIMMIILGFLQVSVWRGLLIAGLIVIGIYIIMAVVTILLLTQEKYNLTPFEKLKAVLYNPVYLVSYVPCALVAVFKRDVTWQRIDHGN